MSKFHDGIISQPLLLPVAIPLDTAQLDFVKNHTFELEQLGFKFVLNRQQCQMRQCPAQLRNKDIHSSFIKLVSGLLEKADSAVLTDKDWCELLADVCSAQKFDWGSAQVLISQAQAELNSEFSRILDLISVPVDLTYNIKQALE